MGANNSEIRRAGSNPAALNLSYMKTYTRTYTLQELPTVELRKLVNEAQDMVINFQRTRTNPNNDSRYVELLEEFDNLRRELNTRK